MHRVEVLRTAVLIYFDAACTVLEHYNVGVMIGDEKGTPGLARFADRSQRPQDPFDLAASAARTLRSEVGLDLASVAEFLSEHLLGRLEELESDAAYLEENMQGSDVRPGDAYLVLQIEDGDVEAVFSAEVMRRRGYPLSAANVPGWFARAAEVADAGSRDEMFTRFAAIEDEFEELEREARKAVHELDERANMR